MNIKVAATISAFILLTGCWEGKDDTQNIVPEVSDAAHPVVNGLAMTPKQFLEKFCTGSAIDKNGSCPAVQREMVKQSAQGELPKGW